MRNILRMRADQYITEDNLTRYIDCARPELARRRHLFDYYNGRHAILMRTYTDTSKPNNRVVSPYANYISNFSTGYFVGEPIQYDGPEDVMVNIRQLNKYNDDSSVNSDLALNVSVCGYGYELAFIDRYGEYRFVSLDPVRTFVIYDDGLENEIRYGIRLYTQHDISTHRDIEFAEVYSIDRVDTYKSEAGVYRFEGTKPNYMNDVPIIEYIGNSEGTGDFEHVMSLIDAFDSIISDEVNESAEFADAYLVLNGMMGTESTDIDEMKTNRVLLLDTDAKASWLTKQGDASSSENLKSRLNQEIHVFSGIPDMADMSFSKNASGVAMKYKLLGLEDITSKKENYFRQGIVRRYELYSEYLALIGTGFNFRDIRIIFTRNLPSNTEEMVEVVTQLSSLLSTKTKLSLLPLDIDVNRELEQLAEEKVTGTQIILDGNKVQTKEETEEKEDAE